MTRANARLSLAVLLLCSAATAAYAQSNAAGPASVGEVVVTAQMREQSLQEVPLAISAYSKTEIKESAVRSVVDLEKYTPSFKSFTLGSGFPRFYMRGVGSNDFNIGSDLTIGIFIDDVYVGRGGSAVSDLADVERVEVLRGPQGALFGRSTIGGAISVVTTKPNLSQASGSLLGTVGNFDLKRAAATLNTPLIDGVLGVRLNAVISDRGGYTRNLFNGQMLGAESSGFVRAAVRYAPNDKLTLDFSADYAKGKSDATGPQRLHGLAPFAAARISAAGFSLINPSPGPHETVSDLPSGRGGQFEDREVYGGDLHIAYDLGWATFTSTSATRGYDLDFTGDYDGTELPALVVRQGSGNSQYSQEFRLTSPGDKRFRWIVGASYFLETVDQYTVYRIGFPILALATAAAGGGRQGPGQVIEEGTFANGNNRSVSMFTDLGYSITPKLTADLSLRYSRDRKRLTLFAPGVPRAAAGLPAGTPDRVGFFFSVNDPALTRAASWDNVSPRFNLTYQATDRVMVYGSVSRGYKPGGFNALQSTGAARAPFGEETVTSYEAGLRADWLEGRLRTNLTLYDYKYDGLQVQRLQEGTGIIIVENAKASGKGAEGEVVFKPVEHLRLSANVAYADTKYDRYSIVSGGANVSLAGNRLVYSPEWAYSLIGQYDVPISDFGKAAFRLEYNYTGKQFFDPDNAARNTQGGYGLLNGRIEFTPAKGGWSLALFGRNLGDKEYLIRTNAGTERVGFPLWLDGLPRTYGVELGLEF